MLVRCYFAFALQILGYCSPVWESAAECHLQLLVRQVLSDTGLCLDQGFLSFCHRRRVAGLCMFYNVNSNSIHCLFNELPSVSTKVLHILAAAGAHPLEFEISTSRTSLFARCFLPDQVRIWNDLGDTVFDTRTLDGCKGAVNRWLLP